MRTISFIVLALIASAAISQGVSPTGSMADNGNCNTGHCGACVFKTDNTKICPLCVAMNINSAGEKCEGAVTDNCKIYNIVKGKTGCIGCDPAYIAEKANPSDDFVTCKNKFSSTVENCASSQRLGNEPEQCNSCKTGFVLINNQKCVAIDEASKIANCEKAMISTLQNSPKAPESGLTQSRLMPTCILCEKGYYLTAGNQGRNSCVKQGEDALTGLNCAIFLNVCSACDIAHGYFASDIAYKNAEDKNSLYQICTKYGRIASVFMAAFVTILA